MQRYIADKLCKSLSDIQYKRILEVGCGTGYYTNLLLYKFPGAQIISFDISKKMIDIAKNRLNENKRVSLIVADAEQIYFNARYQLITSNSCLQWIYDFELFCRDCLLSLSPGGIMHFSTFGPETLKELSYVIEKVLGRKISLPAQGFVGEETINSILKENFYNVKIKEEKRQEIYPTIMDLLSTIKYSGERGANLDTTRLSFTPKLIKDMNEAYIKLFNKIIVTYQIFYCMAEV